MAHGTRISGTQKAVGGGFTRIDGVNKKISKGLALVDGVQREIKFSGGPVTVSISGSPHSKYAYVKANGTTLAATGSYVLEKPLKIAVYVGVGYSPALDGCTVKLNGTKVTTVRDGTYTKKYEFETEADTVTVKYTVGSYAGMYDTYSAAITTS